VQGELEEALRVVLRLTESPPVTVAGRTDAGVHARGQVAHVDVEVGDVDGLARRVNGVLPVDIRVRGIVLAPDGFDARFSALARRYSYRVADSYLDPLRRFDTVAHAKRLDLGAMNAAATLLLGEHDFAAYCKQREGATTVRRLLRLEWGRDDDDVAVAGVEADAFCHSMVRALVGALLAVGDGRRPVEWPAEVLAARVRDSAVTVAPPHGLTLEEVRYPPDGSLAARAAETRRLRG
jgi:tRNA pseudouridine38-40 synthase